MHGRHRHNPLLRVHEMQPRVLRLHCPCLQRKDACDDLQAVSNAVLHFLQQRVLLLQQVGDLPFGGAAVGDIFDCQENELAGVFMEK